jgi:hypothetical protein
VYVANPTIAGTTVSGVTAEGGLAFPPLGCTYFAAPPDVVGTNGLPALPFADFPVTVSP